MDIGLRERKRMETRRDLETATIKLVLRDGLDHTTIDAISDRAHVSTRTFFNYFDSKEDAILGLSDIDITDEILATHLAQYHTTDIAESVIGLLFGIFGPSITDPVLHTSRLQIIRQYPQLIERQMTRLARMNQQFVGAIQTLARAQHWPPIDAPQAEIILAMCGSGMRLAIREWAAGNKEISLSQLEQRAVQLIREVTKTLS